MNDGEPLWTDEKFERMKAESISAKRYSFDADNVEFAIARQELRMKMDNLKFYEHVTKLCEWALTSNGPLTESAIRAELKLKGNQATREDIQTMAEAAGLELVPEARGEWEQHAAAQIQDLQEQVNKLKEHLDFLRDEKTRFDSSETASAGAGKPARP